MSLLPRRTERIGSAITVTTDKGELEFNALEDDWFQDVFIDNLGEQLRRGIDWSSKDAPVRWVLSGREVFVLGERADLRGAITQPRLLLGKDQVVLCADTVVEVVRASLQEAGCVGFEVLTPSDGAPTGWTVFRHVKPDHAVRQTDVAEILNILRPQFAIEISLEEGVRMTRNTWLAENPPNIRVYGKPSDEVVHIDGVEATRERDETYIAQRWDSIGEHVVSCGTATKSYSIVEVRDYWDPWVARELRVPGGRGHTRVAMCGPMVLGAVSDAAGLRSSIIVPATNSVLLGRSPGEICVASSAFGVTESWRVAWPEFEPVWALPLNPLRVDKARTFVLFIAGGDREIENLACCESAVDRAGEWARVVLDARRKGLAISGGSEHVKRLWLGYVQRAKALWRASSV